MTKQQNGVYTLPCVDIRHAYRPKGNNWLHLISFRDGSSTYQAEELSGEKTSQFFIGAECTFKVTHPGKNGGLDWIVFETAGGAANTSQAAAQHVQQAATQRSPAAVSHTTIATEEDIKIAQTAFQCATQYGLKLEWDEETLIRKAYIFAGNIKRIAKEIASATDI